MPASHVLACRILLLLLPASLLLWSGSASADDTGEDTAGGTAAATSVHTAGTQRVRLQALPQVVQQGRRVAPAGWAKTAITATVRPVLVGRPVRLQVQRGLTWRHVDKVRQDRSGRAQFAAPASLNGQPLTYRVKAIQFGGLEAVVSDPVSTERWRPPTWSDEFSGTALAPWWSHRGQSYEPTSLRRCSRGDPAAVQVRNGAVRLSVIRDRSRTTRCRAGVRGRPGRRFAYRLQGHIGTEGAFSFRYGVAAARVKFHHSRGQHGAFWMQPVGGMYPGGPGHEIDVIEYFGDEHPRGGLGTFIHRYEGDSVVKTGARMTKFRSFLKGRRDGWSKNFHVFSVEWTPQVLVFRIDGKETYRVRGGISSARQYPILSILASDYEIPKMKDSRLPQHMFVDWVRVWETGP
ncbi:glycoside hydrolase family 16 protein [Nocardioides sp. Soil805]|uniref:glycoside hydrolase family 16 protein n=1 Tax=Nocardioides sp. Soil805 TaxID=1736416 RepID=UPI000B02199E|nr:glycoside hydrolase family 16 protein [Nocardioides sp. Soil805]